jgi:hypothetical protein
MALSESLAIAANRTPGEPMDLDMWGELLPVYRFGLKPRTKPRHRGKNVRRGRPRRSATQCSAESLGKASQLAELLEG